jgi:hypothetical protein
MVISMLMINDLKKNIMTLISPLLLKSTCVFSGVHVVRFLVFSVVLLV